MIMPKRMQFLKLSDELRKHGVSPDTVDLDAHIDGSLSYPENARNIMSRFKNVSNKSRKSKQNSFGIGNIDFSYASQSHHARSLLAQRMDDGIRAKRTYTEREVSKKPSLLDMWYKRPGQTDIFGIDAFGNSGGRTKKHRPHKR